MRLAPAAAAAPTASNAAQPRAVVLGSAVHAHRPSEGHETRVVEFSTKQISRPAARIHPMATGSHKIVGVSNVVTIIDDDHAIDTSIIGLLERAGYRVAIFGSGEAFLTGERPGDSGCVLLDMQMPGGDSLGVLRALGSRESMPPVLVLSDHGDIHEAVEAMKLGAVDFLTKPYPPESLLAAIGRAVDTGPKRKAAAIDRDAAARIASLSQRQLQVLQGILKAKPNKIIAYELGLSVRTVEAYRALLLIKLSVRGTAEAMRLAMAAGMA
jgi:two-component system response regulator FixJ